MARFEKISLYANDPSIQLPSRSTEFSAGYDFMVAEDTVVPSFESRNREEAYSKCFVKSQEFNEGFYHKPIPLAMVAAANKEAHYKPTLIPTGVKAKLDPGTYLQLSVRSSCPLKYWLVLGNGVGIIDADYYNNTDNEGHIYFQIINLGPYDILLQKGDKIGQGIILPYFLIEDDEETAAKVTRSGGFGSTSA